MLMDLGLPSFNTVTFNAYLICDTRLKSYVNSLVHTAILVRLCANMSVCMYAFVLWTYV